MIPKCDIASDSGARRVLSLGIAQEHAFLFLISTWCFNLSAYKSFEVDLHRCSSLQEVHEKKVLVCMYGLKRHIAHKLDAKIVVV